MIVIADSGSTKTDWCVCANNQTYRFHTKGLNPYFMDAQEILQEIQTGYTVSISQHEITHVYFYGAGCKATEQQLIVVRALQEFFSQAQCLVESDIVGAARALHGNEAGLVAILGTGMSIAYWNGTQIQEMMPSLGYILGDEGSGAYIGKCFIQALFYNILSNNVSEEWKKTFAYSLSEVLENVYKKQYPNRYLASFVPFVYKHKNDFSVQQLLHQIFEQFAEQVEVLAKKNNIFSISCVGSVAYFFKDFVYLALQNKSICLLQTDSTPINALIEYHTIK